VWDYGDSLLIHPPVYFTLLGATLRISGQPLIPLAAGDIFAQVYAARWLNVLIASLTAALLFSIGRRLRGDWLGLALAAVFVFDPFGLRINRRAMLETLAGFLMLASVAVLLMAPERRRISAARGLIAGLLLGLALLTKELIFPILIALALFGGWEWLRQPRSEERLAFVNTTPAAILITLATALLTYLIYPLWTATGGNFFEYWEEKQLGLMRMAGLVQITGWNRPGVSFLNFFLGRLRDYGTSYLLLGLGGLALVGLIVWARRWRSARLLIAWGLVIYPFFAFLTTAGSGNDQFFYFLLLPAVLLIAAALGSLPPIKQISRFSVRYAWPEVSRAALPFSPAGSAALTGLILLALLPINLVQWSVKYGLGTDDAYARMQAMVAKLPATAPLNASGDLIKFQYFFPGRPIGAAATPEEAQEAGIHYFIIAPKDIRSRYGRITPELAEWVDQNGVLLFQASGDSYGDLLLYQVDYPAQPTTSEGRRLISVRSFQPPERGWMGGFIALLSIWVFLVLAAAGLAAARLRRQAHLSVPTEAVALARQVHREIG
jgi:hypothetical protein